MNQSILNDINKKYLEAVKCYEEDIKTSIPDISPEIFINLSFLYWSFAFEFFEFANPNNIPEYWANRGGNRFLEVLNLGLEKFPNNAEIHFWKKYFLHISYGDEFTKEECISLINKFDLGSGIVPYFFLYLFDNEAYKSQRDELINRAIALPTAKNIYIKSLLT